MSDRAKALAWWRSLEHSQAVEAVRAVFGHKAAFMPISTSSGKIEFMWGKLGKPEPAT